jgi:hypothetical protein
MACVWRLANIAGHMDSSSLVFLLALHIVHYGASQPSPVPCTKVDEPGTTQCNIPRTVMCHPLVEHVRAADVSYSSFISVADRTGPSAGSTNPKTGSRWPIVGGRPT